MSNICPLTHRVTVLYSTVLFNLEPYLPSPIPLHIFVIPSPILSFLSHHYIDMFSFFFWLLLLHTPSFTKTAHHTRLPLSPKEMDIRPGKYVHLSLYPHSLLWLTFPPSYSGLSHRISQPSHGRMWVSLPIISYPSLSSTFSNPLSTRPNLLTNLLIFLFNVYLGKSKTHPSPLINVQGCSLSDFDAGRR